jgi:hypothetical protein
MVAVATVATTTMYFLQLQVQPIKVAEAVIKIILAPAMVDQVL